MSNSVKTNDAAKNIRAGASDELTGILHPATLGWFCEVFEGPTAAQRKAWPEIAAGRNTLLLAPTGSGKTLAAFLIAIDRIMFGGQQSCRDTATAPQTANSRDESRGKTVRVLYISPLKALGVDVERNLRAPLAGIRAFAERQGFPFHLPSIGVRSGDTPAAERSRLVRQPPEILITTPESLYLLLTSKSRSALSGVETVIVDEIHSLVSNKRGAHLFVSLERLERLRREHLREHHGDCTSLQRIGLSATQRPLEEIARLLGGADATADPESPPRPREVVVVEAGRRKQLDLTIEVPVEDMTRLAENEIPSGPAAAGPPVPSIWPSIHPRLVELIRQNRSTMIFVNSRRLAERLAAAVNEVAGEEIALAHHGSIARDTRLAIEDRLKRGQLPAIVATSSLELGIDMGAVDMVIQIEAPPSIASGLQRIGRSGHQVDGLSRGIVFPKYRGDLLACSAAAGRMMNGEVEETFFPRNPLDVLAQQIVAMVALGPCSFDDLYATMRGAAPFVELSRGSFENVLDLLAGRYPSDEFAELRPRLTWDRITGNVSPRRGAQRLAILNAGTIPDRGLYGVFLADGDDGRGQTGGKRVGELDEEMVFETRPGDVFLLGASSWRVTDITKDRVLVVPAPGEPGRMPFWRGDGPGRPLEFGRAIGALTRQLMQRPDTEAEQTLTKKHALDSRAARNLLRYLREQQEATEVVPSDETVVIECFVDEIGDWRVAMLSPFGSRVHAPWAMAVLSRLSSDATGEVDMMWTDDGILFRLPESDSPPEPHVFFPSPDEVEDLVVEQLGSTALFSARFRENAARALLLPRQQPGKRTPLWLQRRRAADLLAVASQYASFPILLETYRECLRDVFDLRGLKSVLRDVQLRRIRIKQVQTQVASPFASSLLFSYVGKFIYDGDAPLAERRAATLALDHVQLRELLGDAELRELIDAQAVDELTLELQRLDGKYPIRDADSLHDMLLYLGDLTRQEIAARAVRYGDGEQAGNKESGREQAGRERAGREQDGREQDSGIQDHVEQWLAELLAERRIIELKLAGEVRFAAAEDAARFRDAVGTVAPLGLPLAFLERVADPVGDLVSRYARTHVPFKPEDVAARLGLSLAATREALQRLVASNRVVAGEFLPGGRGTEFCDADVLKKLKRRSLAKLRKQVEPVEAQALTRFLPTWHSFDRPRKGLDGLLDAVEPLQGLPLPASDIERYILPARVADFQPADLDELCAAGEVVWQGVDDLGGGDGRIALFLTDHWPNLRAEPRSAAGELPEKIRELLAERGALFFSDLLGALDQFRHDVLDALWDLVWAGEVTNDTLAPLRSLRQQKEPRRRSSHVTGRRFRSRRLTKLPGSEGRWSLLVRDGQQPPSPAERQVALADQLLKRYGVVTRELVAAEAPVGGFAAVYPVLKAMEEAGRIRRGYFVAGLGAAQFALPGAEDRLRQHTESDDQRPAMVIAASDPANPFGTALRWPQREDGPSGRPSRSAGCRVILVDGELAGFLNRGSSHLTTFFAAESSPQSGVARRCAQALAAIADETTAVFLEKIDGRPAGESEFASLLLEAGFVRTTRGLLHRRVNQSLAASG